MWIIKINLLFCKNSYLKRLFNHLLTNLLLREIIKSKPGKKLPSQKLIKTTKFKAKEQFTN